MLANNGQTLPNGSSSLQNGKPRALTTTSIPSSSLLSSASLASDLPTYFGHDREEVTRILMQALSDLGYNDATQSVMRQSGYALESHAVAQFRQAVLSGDWVEAERLLLGATVAMPGLRATAGSALPPSLPPLQSLQSLQQPPQLSQTPLSTGSSNGAVSSSADGHVASRPASTAAATVTSSGLVLLPEADRSLMRFWVRQQKYLELLEQRETARALSVLRTELAPLYQDTQKLHFLSSLIMCQSPDEIKAASCWDGACGQSRQMLLSDLSRFISPSAMLPEHRLAVLLDRVKNYQASGCVFHTNLSPSSLYSDHYCDKADFPSHILHELDGQSAEVWQIRFSHDGTRLASCGDGKYVIIWEVPSFKVLLQLDGHSQGVGNIAWSPDDKMLVSCGYDNHARIWDTNTGLLVHLFERFDEPVSCCVWATDGQSIVLGSFDRDRALCQWSLDGERLYTWTKKDRTEDLALSPDGQWMVAMDPTNGLHIYNFEQRELEYELQLPSRAFSVTISADSQFLLVNTQNGEILLYNIALRGNPIHKYVGDPSGDCVIRSAFGGADESFVVSGSEDGKLNIWHKNIGVHMFRLDAHKPRCNAVSWSPTDSCLFATCGDDQKIKIWSNSERVRQQRELEAANANGVESRTSNGWQSNLVGV